jgi:hypothetical protein
MFVLKMLTVVFFHRMNDYRFGSNSLKLRSVNPILSQGEVAQATNSYGLDEVHPKLKRTANCLCHYNNALVGFSGLKILVTFQIFSQCNVSFGKSRWVKALLLLACCNSF